MPRYFLQFAYKGTVFHGWQSQPNAVTVQQVMEEKLSILLRNKTELTGCGRTDTGVHASLFYAHFDAETIQDNLVHQLNGMLPYDICVHAVHPVAHDAHVRFDAVKRSYSYYIILNKNPFLKEFTWHYTGKPDIEKMNEACKYILETNSFECFSKKGGQQHTFLCNVTEAKWLVQNDLIRFTVSSNRFLRGMVRAMAGTLLEVGIGKMSMDEFRELLANGNRSDAAQSIPAQGLFLEEIVYPYLDAGRKYPFE